MATIKSNKSKVIMTKVVNINARIPVKNITPPIYGVKTGITMSISDILKCLTRRAIVDQVLSDGSTVRLTTKNFREDFEAQLKNKKKTESKVVDEEKKSTIVDNTSTIKDKAVPTGSIDDYNFIDDIDDDDSDNSEEPEEAGNAIVHYSYMDGTEFDMVGTDPKFPEPIDEDEASDDVDAEVPESKEVTESEEIETTEPVSDEVKATSTRKKSNSKKSGSKKK